MRLTVGQLIGKALKAYGVPYVTGLPGHGNWSMIDAFNDPVSKLPFIQVMHEQNAVHIADAHYRVTGQPIAACTSIGPGATNTVIGLATAHCDSTALLLITGSAATHMRGHGVMQELDRVASPDFPHIAAAVTKRTFDVIRADQVPFVMHRAWNAMLTGRPGPVHMELPLDVQVETTDIDIAELDRRLPVGKARADAQAIEAAIKLLLTAEATVHRRGRRSHHRQCDSRTNFAGRETWHPGGLHLERQGSNRRGQSDVRRHCRLAWIAAWQSHRGQRRCCHVTRLPLHRLVGLILPQGRQLLDSGCEAYSG